MEKEKPIIHIIGAGISGLIAAKHLKSKGYSPKIIEKSDFWGGRVKTDTHEGLPLDRGFQVLLTAYPQVRKHLDMEALQLRFFKPGALLFNNGNRQRIGDPLRDFSALWPTLTTTAGTLSDKLKIFQLSRKLKRKSIDAIFQTEETTTMAYLEHYGFTARIIRNFFRPFFAGIFLENDLRTSSRMFEFIFKMFSEGHAAIPKKGIGAIADQLVSQLNENNFEFEKMVTHIEGSKMVLASGASLESDGLIVTIPVGNEGKTNTGIAWKSCDNLYFETESRTFDTGIIGLVSDEKSLTNNLHYLFDTDRSILSVTVVKEHQLSKEDLAQQVSKELWQHCGIRTNRVLGHYHIAKALPDISEASQTPRRYKLQNGVFRAGDHSLNGSLNAAMLSGEIAAEQLVDYLKNQ